MVRAANERSRAFYTGCFLWTIVAILLTFSGFGVVGFCGSVLLVIWFFGLREKFSNEETASAYSVFNRDGRAIAGSFTSSHLERQLRGGGGFHMKSRSSSSADNDDGDDDDPVRGAIAKAENGTKNFTTKGRVVEQERLTRRQAAAAAAEKRFSHQASDNNAE
jgi:hypothetical protein